MKKRLLSTLLALCMVLALLPGTARAVEDYPTSGDCGDNVTWSYNDSTLTIQGTGSMYDYFVDEETPWSVPWSGGYYKIHAVRISDGVTSIGNWAFWSCSNMTSATIPSSVTSIGSYAFTGCQNLTSMIIPGNVTDIGDYAFASCSKLTSVTIPDGVTNIKESVFDGCYSLTHVTIPSSVADIEGFAFAFCTSLTSVIIPNSVINIRAHAFQGCRGLTSVAISNSITRIEPETFCDCSSLTSVSIPNSVTSIDNHAFIRCNSLTSVTIGGNVTDIGAYAFGGCDSLTNVYYSGSESQWKQIEIGYGNNPLLNATIHYNSTGPDTANSGTSSASEYIYDTHNPGADTYLDADRLNDVTDPTTAAEAVRDTINGMTQEQKDSATGIDLATLYAETAVAKAASKPVTGTGILVNAAAVADLETEAVQAANAVETVLTNGGITTARYLSTPVTLTTNSTSEITIRLDPDILTTSVDTVRVEGPNYVISFKIADWTDALTKVLTFKVAPTRTETLSAVSSVDIEMPGGSTSNPITVSLPKDDGKDTTYQAVVSSTGTAIASKYNPATTNIDGKVNSSGTYSVEIQEVDFTDITSKSAEVQAAIRYLAARGIIGGTGGTNFSPDSSISRAQLTALVVRALGKVDSRATTNFTDVTTANWFYSIAASSQKLGYINGFEDNTFRGDIAINKEQIVVIAARVLGAEMNYKTPNNTATYLSKYSDTVASWAQPQVALATRENLVIYRTDGTLSGAKDMTRGDAAIIIYRLFQRLW